MKFYSEFFMCNIRRNFYIRWEMISAAQNSQASPERGQNNGIKKQLSITKEVVYNSMELFCRTICDL